MLLSLVSFQISISQDVATEQDCIKLDSAQPGILHGVFGVPDAMRWRSVTKDPFTLYD